MIELRTYTHDELAVITGTRNNQGIKRKLERWGVFKYMSSMFRDDRFVTLKQKASVRLLLSPDERE